LTRAEILEAAKGCVTGQRQQDYGTPEDSFGLIGKLWSDYLGHEINSMDVGTMMALLKIARIKGGRGTQDSFVDLAGYAACAGEIATAGAMEASSTAASGGPPSPGGEGKDGGTDCHSQFANWLRNDTGDEGPEIKELEQLLEVSLEKERKLQEKAGVLEAMLKLLRLPDRPCNICKGRSKVTGDCMHWDCKWEQLLEMLGD
jgi:hypothetical protein